MRRESDESDSDESIDSDILNRRDEDFQKIIDQENSAIDELHSLLNKTRQKIIKSKEIEENVVTSTKVEAESEPTGVSLDNLNTVVEMDEAAEGRVCLDSLSEFCKNIGNQSKETNRRNGMNDDTEEDEEDEDGTKNEKKPIKTQS